eukprot:Skav223584  [mRNA]  locus=scaffold689:144587:144856:+ [translate_table: standard]
MTVGGCSHHRHRRGASSMWVAPSVAPCVAPRVIRMGSSSYKHVRFLVLASDGLWDVMSAAEARRGFGCERSQGGVWYHGGAESGGGTSH